MGGAHVRCHCVNSSVIPIVRTNWPLHCFSREFSPPVTTFSMLNLLQFWSVFCTCLFMARQCLIHHCLPPEPVRDKAIDKHSNVMRTAFTWANVLLIFHSSILFLFSFLNASLVLSSCCIGHLCKCLHYHLWWCLVLFRKSHCSEIWSQLFLPRSVLLTCSCLRLGILSWSHFTYFWILEHLLSNHNPAAVIIECNLLPKKGGNRLH